MSEWSLSGISSGIKEGYRAVAYFCASEVKHAFTFDRSTQKFGITPEEQLKGRTREIFKNSITAIFGLAGMAYGMYSCTTNPGVFNCASLTLSTFTALIKLKEVAIQSYWRSKEKKEFEKPPLGTELTTLP